MNPSGEFSKLFKSFIHEANSSIVKLKENFALHRKIISVLHSQIRKEIPKIERRIEKLEHKLDGLNKKFPEEISGLGKRISRLEK